MRFALTVLFCLSVPLISFGQNYYLAGGLNVSSYVRNTFDPDGDAVFNFRPGFHLGIIGDTYFSEKLFVETGVVFSQKASRLQVTRTLTTSKLYTDDRLTLHYLEVPLRIGYEVKHFEEVTLIVSGGIFGGMALSARGTYETRIHDYEFEERYKIPWNDLFGSQKFNSLDYGLTASVGASHKDFQLHLLYARSMANLALPIGFNQCFRISLRYQLNNQL
ncbi:porin family protein [Halocola ammonii]